VKSGDELSLRQLLSASDLWKCFYGRCLLIFACGPGENAGESESVPETVLIQKKSGGIFIKIREEAL